MGNGKVSNYPAWCARRQVLIKKYETHAYEEADCHGCVELEDTTKSWMLQVEHKLVTQSLVAHAWNQQRNFTSSAEEHTKGKSEVPQIALAKDAANNGPNDDANMVGNSSKGGPAKFFECIECCE